MYKLFWSKSAGSMAPEVLFEEIGAAYEKVLVDLDKEQNRSAEFLAVNPMGQIPALVLPDGTLMTESAAMVLHICDRHPEAKLAPPAGGSESARFQRWLVYMAAALYNAGYANEILMASFNPTVSSKQEYPGHEIYRRVFLNRGVPQDRIHILGEQITNTMNESAVLGEYLDLHPAATVTVVTSHYHTRRTRWSFRLHFGSGAKRLRYVSAPEDDFSADDWWLYPKGFEMVGMEHIKIVGYWVMYGRGLWWFGGMAFCLVGWSVYRRRTVPGETPDGALEDSSA